MFETFQTVRAAGMYTRSKPYMENRLKNLSFQGLVAGGLPCSPTNVNISMRLNLYICQKPG